MDWPNLIRFGVGVLRLPPDAFWALTPRELRALLGSAQTIDRDTLDELMTRFPDTPTDETSE